MGKRAISRRDALLTGGAVFAGMAFLRLDRLVAAVPLQDGEEIVPWLDHRTEVPPPDDVNTTHQLVWEELDAWITPNDRFFFVCHFGNQQTERSDQCSILNSHPIRIGN